MARMTVDEATRAFEAVCALSVREQARCVAEAARCVADLWTARCERLRLLDPAPDLLERFRAWLDGNCTDNDLAAAGARLQSLLPEDLRTDSDPSGALAGWALRDICAIALGQGEEVQDDIVATAILYAAGARCGRGAEATELRLDRLSAEELQFLEGWWRDCRSRVSLLSSTQDEAAEQADAADKGRAGDGIRGLCS